MVSKAYATSFFAPDVRTACCFASRSVSAPTLASLFSWPNVPDGTAVVVIASSFMFKSALKNQRSIINKLMEDLPFDDREKEYNHKKNPSHGAGITHVLIDK